MKNETEDIVYRCKDCIKYNLCNYYYRRKETSQICHYFELTERKTGKWTRQNDNSKPMYGWYFCTECGSWLGDTDGANYCSFCGAEMEVDA